MIRNILVTFMLLTASSFSQEIKLDIEDKSYGVKDNVFVKVTGAIENVRVRVFDPDLDPVVTHALAAEDQYFFQVKKTGQYLLLASDSQSDVSEKILVDDTATPKPVEPSSKIGKDIYTVLKGVDYSGVGADATVIAGIFKKNFNKKPAQKLIDDTFSEVRDYLADNPNKDKWKNFFDFLQTYYTRLGIPSGEIDEYHNVWVDTEEAFRLFGESK